MNSAVSCVRGPFIFKPCLVTPFISAHSGVCVCVCGYEINRPLYQKGRDRWKEEKIHPSIPSSIHPSVISTHEYVNTRSVAVTARYRLGVVIQHGRCGFRGVHSKDRKGNGVYYRLPKHVFDQERGAVCYKAMHHLDDSCTDIDRETGEIVRETANE